MNNIAKNQKGFAPLESLLIILILALTGYGGYHVWHSQHNNKPTSASTTSKKVDTVTQGTQVNPQNIVTVAPKQAVVSAAEKDLSAVNSVKCVYLGSGVAYDQWQKKLNSTSEIQSMETYKGTGITYMTYAGSLCSLSNQDNSISFSNEKDTLKPDGTTNITITYGLFVFSGQDIELQASTDLKCADIPPSSVNPPEISSVISGKVTIACSGYTGSIYTYDLSTHVYALIGQNKIPNCFEGSCGQ